MLFRRRSRQRPNEVKTPAPAMPVAARPKRETIQHIHLIDTTIASDNLGDEIIGEAARSALEPLLDRVYVSTSSGHDGLGDWGRPLVADADVVFLLGTNGLAAHDQRRKRFIWTVREPDIPFLAGKVVLLGVGANRYFDKVDPAQVELLSTLLSDDFVHSVRDDLGAGIVRAAGKEVVNTSCPTLWRYAETAPDVPTGKATDVVFTLTKHKSDPMDVEMVRILREHYRTVYFWPQQPRDLTYLDQMPSGRDGIEVLVPNLASYDRLLADADVDVIGTRLHGTIRGLAHGRRSLAIEIDNRATALAAECNLPSVAREAVAQDLADRISADWTTNLALPQERISRFLAQFLAKLP